jgi:hypothetical protein
VAPIHVAHSIQLHPWQNILFSFALKTNPIKMLEPIMHVIYKEMFLTANFMYVMLVFMPVYNTLHHIFLADCN